MSRTPVRAAEAERRGLSIPVQIGLALGFGALVAVRMPDILLRGRFWAEDGSVFLMHAWAWPWPQAALAPYGGYLNIVANLTGLLAWYAPPLDWAPYVSTLVGLLFQICPAIVLLTSGVAWLRPPWAMLAALLLVATPPCTEEVWLSSIAAQCHLTLCAALILALPPRAGAVGVFRLVLLGLGALSGPGTWLLTLLFAGRALLDRSVSRAMQAGVIAAGVLIQLAFFYSRFAGRIYTLPPLLSLDVAFTKNILVPFTGPQWAATIAHPIQLAVLQGHVPWWPAAAMIVILLAGLAMLAPTWRGEAFWLGLAAVMLVAVSYFGSLGKFVEMFFVFYGERYVFVPQVLVGLALLSCALTQGGVVRAAAGGCVVWLLAVGLFHYGDTFPQFAHGPSWRSELALHRRDPSHRVVSWPPPWIIRLPATLPR